MRAAVPCRHAVVCVDDTVIPRALWPASELFVEDALQFAHPVPSALPGARFVAAVPLRRGAEIAGALWAADSGSRAITTDMRERLADFGRLAALYLQQETDAALYRLVAENSADTLIRGTLDGVRRYVSPSISTLLGYEAHELVGKRASENMHPDDVGDFVPQMLALRDGRVDSFVTEHRQRHKDGSWVWMEAFVRVTEDPRSGHRDGYVVSVRDTSRRKELETELVHNASHDVLTGLPNRALLYERLGAAIEFGGAFAVLCVDLDGFKRVNDELGHHVGDLVLAEVGDRLVSCVGARDTVARRGGDEFVIIHVADAPLLESAVALAQCVIDAASAPMTVAEWSGSIGLSIGIALAAGPTAQGEDILRAADRAMYEAKASGHNAYRIAGSV
ncbi:diguanylate cyclase domain-containing protein [Mycolicibacterium frederiksbergense]|uniref:diguanylate cyclase domain-containing protein n=1 Tax=Mycolicibacterium frederiksbergense TaxID=117567 RepID=UPI00399BE885